MGIGNHKERDHLRNPDIDRKVILKLNFKKYDVRVLAGFRWLTMEPRKYVNKSTVEGNSTCSKYSSRATEEKHDSMGIQQRGFHHGVLALATAGVE
jgi:hypothetical protein